MSFGFYEMESFQRNEAVFPPGTTNKRIKQLLQKHHGYKKSNTTDYFMIHPTVMTLLSMDMLNNSPFHMWSNGATDLRNIIKKFSVRTVILREIINMFFSMVTIEDISKDWREYLAYMSSKFNLNETNYYEEYQLFLAILKNTLMSHTNTLLCYYDRFLSSLQDMFERALNIYFCLGIVPYAEIKSRKHELNIPALKDELLKECKGHCEKKFICVVEQILIGAIIHFEIPRYEDILVTYNIYTNAVKASLIKSHSEYCAQDALSLFSFKNTDRCPNYTYSNIFNRVMLNTVCDTMLMRELKIDCLQSARFRLHVKNLAGTTVIIQDNLELNDSNKAKNTFLETDTKSTAIEASKEQMKNLCDELKSINKKANSQILGMLKELSEAKDLASIKNIMAGVEAQMMINENNVLSLSDIENLCVRNVPESVSETMEPYRLNLSMMDGSGYTEALERSKLNSTLQKLQNDLKHSMIQIKWYKQNIKTFIDRIAALGENNSKLLSERANDIIKSNELNARLMKMTKQAETDKKRIEKLERDLCLENSKSRLKEPREHEPIVNSIAGNRDPSFSQCASYQYMNTIPANDVNLINISRIVNENGDQHGNIFPKYLNAKFASDSSDESIICDIRNMWKEISSNVFFLRDITFSVNGNSIPRQLSEASTRVYLNSFLNFFTGMKIRSVVVFDDELFTSPDIGDSFFNVEMKDSVLDMFGKRMQSYGT